MQPYFSQSQAQIDESAQQQKETLLEASEGASLHGGRFMSTEEEHGAA